MSAVGSGRPKHGTVTKYKIIQLDDDPPPSRVPSRYYEREPERDRLQPREWKWERETAPPGELERYTRSTEYYAPQPIIIRSDPVIIREPAEQQMVLRDRDRDRDREERRPSPRREEERQLARRPQTPEEDYYYERRTRELDRRGRDDYDYDDRDYRREVRPRDSASQYQGQGDDYSDDEYYYRKETTRGSSPNHKRHLAEGAVVGLGAAALLQHHRKTEGEKAGGYGQLIGGAALGTVGAELVTRVRDHYTRSSSEASEDRGGRAHSQGPTNLAKLGAVAALGALATYAVTRNKKGKNGGDDRRSRSRRRRGSVSRNHSRSESRSSAQDAKRKNNVIAGAGLASAAAAGIWERTRSKSRPGRSKSRVKQGVPIVAAGLGGAALAGLYEKQKTKGKAPPRARSASRRRTRHEGSRSSSGSRSRSRSRSRGREADFGPYADGYFDANRDRNLIEYGEDPIVTERPTARHHRRRSPSSSTSPPPPRKPHEERSRSRGHWDSGREGSAAHEASKRREKNRADKGRHRHDQPRQEQIEHSNDPYNFGPYAQAPPPAAAPSVPVAAYPPTGNYESEPYPPRQYSEDQYQPHGNYFPPPPAPTAQGPPLGNYDNSYASPYEQLPYPGSSSNLNQYQQYPNDDRHRQDNVSTASSFYAPERDVVVPMITFEPPMLGSPDPPKNDAHAELRPPVRRAKSVQFDLGRNESRAIDDQSRSSKDIDDVDEHDRYHRPSGQREKRRNSTGAEHPSTRHVLHEERSRYRNASRESASSDETIELPARFDRRGRKLPERGDDPRADKLEDILNGRGLTGGLLKVMAGEIGAGGGRR